MATSLPIFRQDSHKPDRRSPYRHRSEHGLTTPVILAIAGAVVVVLAIVAVIAAQSGTKSTATSAPGLSEYQSVAVVGAHLPVEPTNASQTDTAPGLVAPTLEGKTFSGQDVTIGPDGKPKAVMFFAHWCPHCQNEAPLIASWVTQHAGQYNIEYFGVATNTDPTHVEGNTSNFPPSAWLARIHFTPTVLVDNHAYSAWDAYGGESFPYLVFLDSKNKVVIRVSGEITMDEFEQHVKAAVAAG